jgi:VanZ family protein
MFFMFLAWRESSWLGDIEWMPRWISRWADVHGVTRNFAAFLVFGIVGFALLGRGWRQMALFAFFAIGIEVAQLWIPNRYFDWRDIAASLAGLLLGWTVVFTVAMARPKSQRC